MTGYRTAMSSTNPSPQPAAARRAAEARLRELLEELAPGQDRLVAAVRRWLRKRLPAAIELVYGYSGWVVSSFSPSDRGYDGVFAIRADPEEVKLYFNRGKGLPDPEKLLQGKAKLVRWIPLPDAAALKHPAVVRLVDAAIARDGGAFASEGRGAVVIRQG